MQIKTPAETLAEAHPRIVAAARAYLRILCPGLEQTDPEGFLSDLAIYVRDWSPDPDKLGEEFDRLRRAVDAASVSIEGLEEYTGPAPKGPAYFRLAVATWRDRLPVTIQGAGANTISLETECPPFGHFTIEGLLVELEGDASGVVTDFHTDDSVNLIDAPRPFLAGETLIDSLRTESTVRAPGRIFVRLQTENRGELARLVVSVVGRRVWK